MRGSKAKKIRREIYGPEGETEVRRYAKTIKKVIINPKKPPDERVTIFNEPGSPRALYQKTKTLSSS